MIKYSFLGEL